MAPAVLQKDGQLLLWALWLEGHQFFEECTRITHKTQSNFPRVWSSKLAILYRNILVDRAKKMEHACECLINGIWWLLKSFKVSEVINIETCKSCLGLCNKWLGLIQRFLCCLYKSFDFCLDLVANNSLGLSFFTFLISLSLLFGLLFLNTFFDFFTLTLKFLFFFAFFRCGNG